MEKNIEGIELNKDLFSYSGKTDSKHILNTCNKVVPQDILDKIESGITLEDLDEIRSSGLDIFAYQTQITIHGLFPDLGVNYFGGYKCLFQNKNKSIGVRWSAIDYEKLKYIYDECVNYGFKTHRSSSEHYIYKSKYVNNKEELMETAKEFNRIAANIDTSLFYGNISIYAAKTMFGVVCRFDIGINAIYQKNIETIIEQITGANIEQREQLKADKERQREAQRKQWESERLQEEEQRRAKRELFLASDNLGWELRTEQPKQGLIFAKIDRYDVNWRFYIVTKVAKKYFYYKECDINGVYNYAYEQRSILKDIKAYFAPICKKEEPTTAKVSAFDIQIIDYSDRAIAIIGNTKPYKEVLQKLGCKFNPKLSCGVGWVAQKSREGEIKKSLNIHN